MSGIWRNLLTLLFAFFSRDESILKTGCSCTFLVTPFDVGVSRLKSDKYWQLAESAQLDFGLRSGLVRRMRQAGCSMVNVTQHIQFDSPAKLFDRTTVQTNIIFADAKHIYFQHLYSVNGRECATAIVKGKFKAGRMTQSALELTGLTFAVKPSFLM